MLCLDRINFFCQPRPLIIQSLVASAKAALQDVNVPSISAIQLIICRGWSCGVHHELAEDVTRHAE